MGKKQSWVSKRLKFGAVLVFIPTWNKDSAPDISRLTEGAFRKLWSKTRGKDEDRFRQVLTMLGDALPPGSHLGVDDVDARGRAAPRGHRERLAGDGVKPPVGAER